MKRHQDSIFASFLRLPALRNWISSDGSVVGLWNPLCVTTESSTAGKKLGTCDDIDVDFLDLEKSSKDSHSS